MSVLILNAGTASPISLNVQTAGEGAPEEVGSVTRSFNFADRSSVRGVKRNYASLTTFVDTATKDSVINLLKWGNQIPCSGDLLANIQTQCTVRYTGCRMIPGLGGSFWEVGLSLNEVQPNVTLARYAPGDTITGETFTGPANRTYLDVNAAVRYALVNTKRDNHFPSNGVRSLLIEGARTNLIIRSEAFDNAAWTKATGGAGSLPVVTADNGVAPDGFVTAEKVVFVAPAAGDQSIITQSPTVVNATQYAAGVYVKAFAAGDIGKVLVFRQVGSSAYALLTLTALWQRLGDTETSVSTTGLLEIGLRPNQGGSTGTVSIFIWAGQMEAGAFASSYIPTTTAAVARTTESYQLPFTTPPQELTVYIKGVEAGTVIEPSAGLFALGGSANASLLIWNPSGKYQAMHRTAVDVTSTAAAAPAIGDVVELRLVLFADGSVQLGQSINGATEVLAAQSAANALATSWVTKIAYIGDRSGAAGFFAFQSFKIIAGARSLAEMRSA